MRRLLTFFLLAAVVLPKAYPWGSQGHAAIGTIAAERLSPTAAQEIKRILGNDDLGSIASWMDQVLLVPKNFGPLAGSVEAHAFAAQFPHSFYWHFVDLPLDSDGYQDNSPFARPDDVVHEVNIAIDVLEGRSKATSERFAVYMLVHLVGDMHQPLHVACGFYDLSDPTHPRLLTEPAAARGKPSDEGGNLLRFGDNKLDELHALWDIKLPAEIAGSQDVAALVSKITPLIDPKAFASPGDYHRWAEGWATESVIAARSAYKGLSLGAATIQDGKLKSIQVTLPDGYDQAQQALASKRLAQASYHLAELLNAIEWSDLKK